MLVGKLSSPGRHLFASDFSHLGPKFQIWEPLRLRETAVSQIRPQAMEALQAMEQSSEDKDVPKPRSLGTRSSKLKSMCASLAAGADSEFVQGVIAQLPWPNIKDAVPSVEELERGLADLPG